jgi:peptide-methionine (S)-S-oxide reductase
LGVQEFLKHLPGVLETGKLVTLRNPLKQPDGYAECVKTSFDSKVVSIEDLIHYF